MRISARRAPTANREIGDFGLNGEWRAEYCGLRISDCGLIRLQNAECRMQIEQRTARK